MTQRPNASRVFPGTKANKPRGTPFSVLAVQFSFLCSPFDLHLIMSTEGLVFKDLLPIPDTDPTEPEEKAATILDKPTESHALALEAAKQVHPDEKGAAQLDHEKEVVNLGWNEPKEQVESPLVGGLANEELWLLVRRFNKVSSA